MAHLINLFYLLLIRLHLINQVQLLLKKEKKRKEKTKEEKKQLWGLLLRFQPGIINEAMKSATLDNLLEFVSFSFQIFHLSVRVRKYENLPCMEFKGRNLRPWREVFALFASPILTVGDCFK